MEKKFWIGLKLTAVSGLKCQTRKELRMYSPKIESEQVRKLYLLKMSFVSLEVTKAMTQMVREALDEYIPRVVKEILKSGGTLIMPDELLKKEGGE